MLLLFIVALGYAGYLLLGGDTHRQDAGVDDSANSASTSGGSISPYSPAQNPRNLPTSTVTNVPTAKAPPAPGAPPHPRVAQHYKDVPDALRAARAALMHNNLADAKSALSDALSLDSNNADARQLQGDLQDRENKRDVALGVANTCAKDKLWSCVHDRAAQALAIDVSSVDAQALLERVILTTGWKPLANAAASAPRAATAPAGANANARSTASAAPNTAASPLPTLPTLPPLPPATPTNNAATTNNAVNPTPSNTAAASAVGGIDAQMRAIRESGWKQAPSANKQ